MNIRNISNLYRSIRAKNQRLFTRNQSTINYNSGDVIHGYRLEKFDFIEELNIRPFLLKHESTGAEHLHIQKEDDSNNVFAVSLRTTPKNSTGVAHILEHVALCGSKRYPVRDPYFKMLTRSLATFMNAMTGPDYTVYPFSTQNQKDFENLLNVYTDAVFFPLLKPADFRQEGWRLEHETPDQRETPIILKGVVYNEMKGVFSSSAAIYCRLLLNHLFPDTTYHFESGGDPEHIPSLSHDDLKKFHRIHYHPSNAKFFTYGDIPLEHHLKLLNKLVMSKFSENSQAREQSQVHEQATWKSLKTVNITCPIDPLNPNPDKQITTSISYLLPTLNTNYEEIFALKILSSLLLDGPNAPFYKNLIESGIGSDYSPSTGFGDFTKQPFFSVGLQNISSKDIEKVHEIIYSTLKETAKVGFPKERIDSILHSIELGLKHVSGNFGLRLLMSLESHWNHDGDPIDHFRANHLVERFKNSLANDKNYWTKLIEKYFLKNNHRLILNMMPDKNFEDRRKERETRQIEDRLSKLSDVDKQTILYEGMELKKMQNTKDQSSVLPCLEPSKDIPSELSYKCQLNFETYEGVNIQLCEQPTNEVIYFRAMTDVTEKLNSAGLIDYLPLFCDVSTKLGAGSYDRHKFAQQTQLTTAGLGVSLSINPSLSELDKFKCEVLFGSHCLRRNIKPMFELWTNVFKQIHFLENKDYLHQLIKASTAELSEGISQNGHLYAMKKSSSSLNNIGALDERLSGLSFVTKMKDMASKESIDSIAEKLQAISEIVFNPFNIKCSINAEPKAMQESTNALKEYLGNSQALYKASQDINQFSSSAPEVIPEVTEFPFATHYVAKSLIAVPRLHEDFAKLVILCKLVSSRYLLGEIREKGGAYGAGLKISNSGILSFFSYRDPNSDATLKVFNRTSAWISNENSFGEKDIDESKLSIFQDVDKPIEPGKRGQNFFILGETDEMRQNHRKRLLAVTKDDVLEVATRYLNQDKVGVHII